MNKNNKGFTLAELLIAIALMSIILILALPSLRSFLTKNKEKEYLTLRNSIISAAKLYTDSSNEDMFGSNNSGCVMLTYNQLKAKNLIKEYEQDGITCSTFSTVGLDGVNRPFINSWTYYGGTDETDVFCKGLDASSKIGDICPEYDYGVEGNSNNQSFVRVYKVGNYYHYQYAIDCYKDNKKVFTENTIQGECLNVEDQSPPTIIFKKNGSDNEYYQNFKTPINIYDQSTLSQTVSIKYAWITTGNTQDKIVNPYLSTINRKANISKASYGDDNEVNPLIREQLINLDGTEKMISWKTKTIKVKKNGTTAKFTIDSPKNKDGSYYLIIKPVFAEDGVHNSWTGFKYAGEEKDGNYYWISNPVLLDNTPPTIDENDITMVNKECNEKDNDYNTAHGKCILTSEDTQYINNSWTNRDVYVRVENTSEDFSGIGYITYKTDGAEGKEEYCEKNDIECHDKNYLDVDKAKELNNPIVLSRKVEKEGTTIITFKVCDKTNTSNGSKSNCSEYSKRTINTDYTAPTNNLTYKFYDNTTCNGNEISLAAWTKNGSIKASGSNDKFGGKNTLEEKYKNTSGISKYQYIYRGSSDQGTIVDQVKENDGNNACAPITMENKTKEQYTNIKYSICDNLHNCSNYVTDETSKAKAKLNIDKTPPTCASTSDNTNWTKVNVKIHGTCTDSISGCVQETIDKTISVEGNKNTSPGIAKDKAGNETPCPTANTKIDKTPPTCTSTSDTINWTKNNVTIHGTCTDNISGCAQAKIDKTITDEGNKYTSPGKIKDNAGNETTCSEANTKIDKTPPTCTSKSDNTNWTKNNVTIRGTCTDTLSGCSQARIDKTITTQGNQNTSPGNVKDKAGNETPCPTANTKIDKTPPTCTSKSDNTNWTKSNVAIHGTCSDTLSGCAQAKVDKTITTQGNLNTSPGKVKDKVGNETTCPNANTKIDKTAPTCTSKSDNTNWTKNNVAIHGTCSDTLSGCAQAKIDKTITTQGNNNTSPGKVKDKAGNETPCPTANTKIDKTPPTISSIKYSNYTCNINECGYKVTVTAKDSINNSLTYKFSKNGNATGLVSTRNKEYFLKTPNSSSVSTYVEVYDGVGNAAKTTGLSLTPYKIYVYQLYNVYLHKDPPSNSSWFNSNPCSAAMGLAFSNESKKYFDWSSYPSSYSAYEQWVTLAFKGAFGRDPDSIGFPNWVAFVNGGNTYQTALLYMMKDIGKEYPKIISRYGMPWCPSNYSVSLN